MNTLADNNVIKFINVNKKKDGMFANFKAKGIRGGVSFTASIAVDISSSQVDPADPLEKIIESCAKTVEKELRRSEFQFEGMPAV